MAWLAVRGVDPAEVLGLQELGQVDWRHGLDLAYFTDDRVVVSAPVDGWVLVVGLWLLSADVSVAALSAELHTEVQAFASHRGLQVYRWERAVDGDLLRSFVFDGAAGEVIRDVGVASALEQSFGALVDEADVFRVAGAWSVDPRKLDVPVRVFTSRT